MKELFTAYLTVLRPYKLRAYSIIALLTLSGFVEGATILSLQPLMNAGFGETQSALWEATLRYVGLTHQDSTIFSLFLFGIFGLSSAVLHLITDSMLLKIRAIVESQNRQIISKAILHTPWPKFLSLRLGEIGDTILMDGMHIAHGLSLFLYGLGAMMTMIGLIVCTILVSLEMSIYTFGFCIGGYCLLRWTASIAKEHAKRQKSTLAKINELVCDVFNNLKYFRGTGFSKEAGNMTTEAFEAYGTAYYKASFYSYAMRFAVESGGVLCILAFFWASLELEIVKLSAAIVFLALFYRTVPRIMTIQQSFYQAGIKLPWYTAMQTRLAHLKSNETASLNTPQPSFKKALELRDIEYTFPEAKYQTLKGINLTIKQGSFISLVGPSGGGKSSIIDLCLGLLSPDKGTVLIDGVNLKNLDQHSWRCKVGLVLQESPIFHGTILDNISWGEKSQTDRWLKKQPSKLAHGNS